MYDKDLVVENLRNISWSLEQISKRFKAIESSDDFIKDDIGLEKLVPCPENSFYEMAI